MQKNKSSQKGSGIIAFIVIPLVISAVVMTAGRATKAILGLALPAGLILATPTIGQDFTVAMEETEELQGESGHPFKCMVGDHAYASGRIFFKSDGELFLAGIDDGFQGYSTRDERPYKEAAHDFCSRVLQRKRGGS